MKHKRKPLSSQYGKVTSLLESKVESHWLKGQLTHTIYDNLSSVELGSRVFLETPMVSSKQLIGIASATQSVLSL